MSKKIIVATVVAVFCMTAFAAVADESDAAKKDYIIYGEVLSDDLKITETFYIYFSSEADNEKYIEAANAEFEKNDIPVAFEMGKYGPSPKYKGDGNTSCFYSDGNNLVKVTKSSEDYINHTKSAFSFINGWISAEEYEALSPAEKENWLVDEYMGAQKIPACDPATYDVKDYVLFATVIHKNLTDFDSTVVKFKSEAGPIAWCAAVNAEFADENSIFNKISVSYSGGSIMVAYGTSYNNATYVKVDGKWTDTEDTAKEYPAAKEIDFELDYGFISESQYNDLSSAQQKLWKETGWGGEYAYKREATGEVVEKALEIALIIGVVIVLIVIAVIVFFVLRSRKKQAA